MDSSSQVQTDRWTEPSQILALTGELSYTLNKCLNEVERCNLSCRDPQLTPPFAHPPPIRKSTFPDSAPTQTHPNEIALWTRISESKFQMPPKAFFPEI